ncbi:hypothetical protein [Streptomyces sp. NPDC058305]|uniref:hypothetical protein n=1 Tax=Streptomyces sp. NPDC058305 TaxID=3346438 RepID=UPI0036E06B88
MAEVVVTESAEVAPAFTEAGLSVAVTPVGAPVTFRATCWAAPDTTEVETVAEVLPPGATEAAPGATATPKSSGTGVPGPLKSAKAWLKAQVSWAMPEQVSLPPVPGQPPLSRWRAQNERVLIPCVFAQESTAAASAVVNVSAAPKSSMPGISVTPMDAQICAVVISGCSVASWLASPAVAVFVSSAMWCVALS